MQSATLVVLEKANLPPAHARAIAEGIEIEFMALKDTFATKLDLAELRRALEVEIGSVRTEISNLRTGMSESGRGLEVKIESVRGEVVRWVVMCILGQTAVLIAGISFVLNHWVK
jgi:hypothetical protein